MLKYIARTKHFAIHGRVLLDDGSVRNGANNPLHAWPLRTRMIKRKPKKPKSLAAARRRSEREHTGLLPRSSKAIVEHAATSFVNQALWRIETLKVFFKAIT